MELESRTFREIRREPPFVRKAFPELGWLKAQTSQRTWWPTLIMNATATNSWRPDIRGPLTLFMNLTGTSHVSVDGYRVPVSEQVCFISNAGQNYSLEIESATPVETFNLHVGEELLTQTLESLILSPERLLEGGKAQSFCFPNRLQPKDQVLQSWLQRVRRLEASQAGAQDLESALHDLLVWLLGQQAGIQHEINRLPALKQGTRSELHQRLNRARDCLYISQEQLLDLDTLASVACLSKYHFLRLFKSAYGCTPHQFQLRLRMEKAGKLLARTPLSVQAIAWQLGFEDVSSFSRQFRSQLGVYPSQYRRLSS